MKTSLIEEREEQQRWRFRPRFQSWAPRIARLVDAEFAPAQWQATQQGDLLSRMGVFAASASPYWERLFRERQFDPVMLKDTAALALLPVLSKSDLLRYNGELRASRLPKGERVFGWTSSSGTTGQPARVLHSVSSNLMFTLLTQRNYRWYRLDPMGKFASIRLSSQLPMSHGESPLPDGATGTRPAWRYAGTLFETGPHAYFSVTNPVERQLEWLAELRPDYLLSYSETLEHLVFASEGRWPAPGIRKMIAISEQLTPSMRHRIEASAGTTIEQGYGLNEFGVVAGRCAAGRYHVHTEHCVVEIVDDAGRCCAPGVIGRIVISTLTNTAMPLFRYDTGDLAAAVGGPCACGRTLPSFGDLVGRYSRIAYLPDGTLAQVGALRAALEAIPADIVRNLRQFQIHQFRDRSLELRLVTAGTLPPEFDMAIRAAWKSAAGEAYPLRITTVASIQRSPGGKFQDFTSDFMPRPDHESGLTPSSN